MAVDEDLLSALLRTVADDEVTGMQVLADWLLERGAPTADIVASVARARSSPSLRARVAAVRRAAELLRQAPADERPDPWMKHWLPLPEQPPLHLDLSDLHEVARDRRHYPFRCVQLHTVSDEGEMTMEDAAVVSRWLQTIPLRELDLWNTYHSGNTIVADEGLGDALFGDISLPELRRLETDLSFMLPTDMAVRAPRLQQIQLSHPDCAGYIGDAEPDDCGWLSAPSHVTQLQVGWSLSRAAAALLATTPWPLRDLRIIGHDETLHGLRAGTVLSRLDGLEVAWIETEAVDELARFFAELPTRMRRMSLRMVEEGFLSPGEDDPNDIGGDIVTAWIEAGRAAAHHELRLAGLAVDAPIQAALKRAPLAPRTLVLSSCGVGREVAKLGELGFFASVRSLTLRNDRVTTDALATLIEHAPSCTSLTLDRCDLDPRAVELLVRSTLAQQLELLELHNEPGLGDAAVQLIASASMPRLHTCQLRNCGVTSEGAAALEGASFFDSLQRDPLGRDALAYYADPTH